VRDAEVTACGLRTRTEIRLPAGSVTGGICHRVDPPTGCGPSLQAPCHDGGADRPLAGSHREEQVAVGVDGVTSTPKRGLLVAIQAGCAGSVR